MVFPQILILRPLASHAAMYKSVQVKGLGAITTQARVAIWAAINSPQSSWGNNFHFMMNVKKKLGDQVTGFYSSISALFHRVATVLAWRRPRFALNRPANKSVRTHSMLNFILCPSSTYCFAYDGLERYRLLPGPVRCLYSSFSGCGLK